MKSTTMWELISNDRNFGLLFWGRLVTNMGDSLYAIAAMWLVYELEGSSLYTGLAYALTYAPSVLSFAFGPLVDRFPLKPLIVFSQVCQALIVMVIPIIYFFGQLTVTIVLILIPLAALLNVLAYFAESTALPRIVTGSDLVPANAALAFSYQGTDLVFNAVAGLLIATVGVVAVFLIDIATFVVAILLFLALKLPRASGDVEEQAVPSSYLQDLKEGFTYIFRSVLAPIILSTSVLNLLFGASLAILPVHADGQGGVEIYGLLLAGLSGGMLVGSLTSERFAKQPVGWVVIISYSTIAILWVVFAFSLQAWSSITFLFLAAVPFGLSNVFFISLVQKLAPEKLLGRIQASAGSLNTIGIPVGAALGGWLATLYGTDTILVATGVTFLLVAAFWFLNPTLRRLGKVDELENITLVREQVAR